MTKYLPFILAGLFIDGLKAGLAWTFLQLGLALQTIGPVLGAAGGAATGALYCWNTSTGSIISSIRDSAHCAGQGVVWGASLSVMGLPLGVGMGMITDFCISITFGLFLILALAFSGMYYPAYLFGGGLFELIPGFNVLPGWTALAVYCTLRKMKEERELEGNTATALATITSPKTITGRMLGGVTALRQQNAERQQTVRMGTNNITNTQERPGTNRNFQSVDGISPKRTQLARDVPRAANDNTPKSATENVPQTRYVAA